MRKLVYAGIVLAMVACFGCRITNYPVIVDTVGPWQDSVLDGQYDQAYIIPSGVVATIYPDGSDESYTLVHQDWKGDQWLYTYNNFDPTASVVFLDQTYCDPNHQEDCWVSKSWNPDYPDVYPWNGQNAGNDEDDVFDEILDPDCKGFRSICVILDMPWRNGECGSGLWQSPQDLAAEFSLLKETTFRGREVYALPIDTSVARFTLVGTDGYESVMPIYGSYTGYLDQDLQLAFEVTPNVEYQRSWLVKFTDAHGDALRVNVLYGSLSADYRIRLDL
jgi:hypothetical protein